VPDPVLLALVAAGLAARTLMVWAQRRALAAVTPPPPAVYPPVSVLKPVKGEDAGLEANLRSVFAQAYPDFEVLVGAADADDPAVAVARRVAAEFPRVRSRVVVDAREIGPNPKVSNLANLLRHARHETLLISDSNVRVAPDYLEDLVRHLEQPGVGLVSSPIRGAGAAGLGGRLDALHLNTFVMGGTAALHRLFGAVCVVGKSMLLRRRLLAELGGFEFLGQFLAEDQVCGQEVRRRGHALALSGRPVDNVVGAPSVRQFAGRYLRWARIRRHIAPAGYRGEVLLSPVAVAFAGLVAGPTVAAVATFLTAWLGSTLLAAASERRAGVGRPLAAYPLPVLAMELLTGLLWPLPLLTGTVRWRGRRLRIGARTRLLAAAERRPFDAASPGEPAPSSA